jgi:hypothetical protein
MRLSTSVFGLAAWSLFAAPVFAEEAKEVMVCGFEASEDHLAISKELQQKEIDNAFDKDVTEQATVNILMHFHVLAANQQEMNGIPV